MAAIWEFQPSNNPPDLRPTIDYRVHTPKLTQLVTGKDFHYFKLRLFDINRYFQVKKGWNQDYKPAQQIYSDNPTSLALRAAIQGEHSVLYSSRPWRDGNEDGDLNRTGNAFFELLDKFDDKRSVFATMHDHVKAGYEFFVPKQKKDDDSSKKLKIYTYVLLDDTLRFSRCGAGTTVDMSSKHALHAGAAESVFYAGEFWTDFQGIGFGERVLFIDNNSGTFAPPKQDLFRMKFLMEANFPGINVVTLDYQDPEWKHRRGKDVK